MASRFFQGKKVLVTGHTGFKGAWLSIWLRELGAQVVGYSLDPPYPNSLFELSNLKEKVMHIRGDLRDFEKLRSVFKEHEPDIVFHLAAQSRVRKSYDVPRETFTTNTMGSMHILECIRKYPVKSAVMITSDKCYKNKELTKGYVETDEMSDQDPYSCSKGCIELIAESYRNSFGVRVATTRAGNAVGGGDWAQDRLVPDIIRALMADLEIVIRSPNAVRPWQFVLEPLSGYMLLGEKLFNGEKLSGAWNFGPNQVSMVTVKKVVDLMIGRWGSGSVRIMPDDSKYEATLLFLDCTKAKKGLQWEPRTDIKDAVDFIVQWYKNYGSREVYDLCVEQIKRFEGLSR